VLFSFFSVALKIKNPAGAITEDGATSIAMKTARFSDVDQIGQVIA
jgi:hypothetical protein